MDPSGRSTTWHQAHCAAPASTLGVCRDGADDPPCRSEGGVIARKVGESRTRREK